MTTVGVNRLLAGFTLHLLWGRTVSCKHTVWSLPLNCHGICNSLQTSGIEQRRWDGIPTITVRHRGFQHARDSLFSLMHVLKSKLPQILQMWLKELGQQPKWAWKQTLPSQASRWVHRQVEAWWNPKKRPQQRHAQTPGPQQLWHCKCGLFKDTKFAVICCAAIDN